MTDPDDEWGDEEVGAGWVAAGTAAVDDREGRAARRTLQLLAVAATIVVLAVVATVLADHVRPSGDRTAPDDTTSLGPVLGAGVDAYIASRAQALDLVPGGEQRVAVVSLVSYRPTSAAAALGAPNVLAYLVALPGRAPEVVGVGNFGIWLDDERADVQADRDSLAELLPTVSDPDFRAGYQADLDRDDLILATLGPDTELAFGAVVVADGLALRRIADRSDVRLVDVFPRNTWQAAIPTTGLRPEETATAGTPPTRR